MPHSPLGDRRAPETLQQALLEIEILNRRVLRERLSRIEAEELAEQAMRVAVEDPLTKLANRNMVNDQLRLEIEIAKRRNSTLLVLYMDLDGFKAVNDTYGHETGDMLLCHMADVLKSTLRPEDIVGRLGGDEFVVISNGVPEKDTDRFIQRLQTTLKNSPLPTNGLILQLRVSIGGAVVDGNTSVDDALHFADTAMYHAKNHSTNGCCLYNEQLALDDEVRRHTMRALATAISNEELVIHYQPIVDVRTGYIEQLEALIRWQSNGQLLQPESFISFAEESGYINDIGRYVLERSLSDIAYWQKHLDTNYAEQLNVAINVSAKQLLDPRFASNIAQLMKIKGLSPRVLSLEVTEPTLVGRDNVTSTNLRELSKAGHKIALDDFGTGNSSLTVLRDVSFDTVKIDRTFVGGTASNESGLTIIRAINTVAHALGTRTAVEGIETRAQLRTAIELGCDYAQGYFLSRAMPAGQIETLFDTHFDMPSEARQSTQENDNNVILWPVTKQWRLER